MELVHFLLNLGEDQLTIQIGRYEWTVVACYVTMDVEKLSPIVHSQLHRHDVPLSSHLEKASHQISVSVEALQEKWKPARTHRYMSSSTAEE